MAKLLGALRRWVTEAGWRAVPALVLAASIVNTGGIVVIDGRVSDLAARVKPDAEEEQRRFRARLVADAKVDRVLGEVMEAVNGDRMVVRLAHNGQTDLSGAIPFLYLTVGHVHQRAGLAWEERWSRPVALAAWGDALRRMYRQPAAPVCVKRDRGDEEMSEVARALMKDQGTELAFVCPLQGPGGHAGTVTVQYLRWDTHRPTDAMVLDRLNAAARRVHAALTGSG